MFPNSNTPALNQCQMYPHRKDTKFYTEPQIPDEYQSRRCEHAYDKLRQRVNFANTSEGLPKVAPARTSSMKVLRNSYFS